MRIGANELSSSRAGGGGNEPPALHGLARVRHSSGAWDATRPEDPERFCTLLARDAAGDLELRHGDTRRAGGPRYGVDPGLYAQLELVALLHKPDDGT